MVLDKMPLRGSSSSPEHPHIKYCDDPEKKKIRLIPMPTQKPDKINHANTKIPKRKQTVTNQLTNNQDKDTNIIQEKKKKKNKTIKTRLTQTH